MNQTLLVDQISPFILQVTLHRPQVHNAINSVMMLELSRLWDKLNGDHEQRCIIITGSGDKAFCAGADLKERQNLSLELWQSQHVALEQAMHAMIDCPLPIIAAVNGVAFGGGLELALACDFIYAADHAVFAQSEVKLGIMPGAMGTQNLPRACGLRRAKELSFTGAPFSATQAFEWGVVNKVCQPEQLMHEVITVATQISENAPIAVRQVKKVMQTTTHLDLHNGYETELAAYYQLIPTQDREEGIRAFNEKRKPVFTDK